MLEAGDLADTNDIVGRGSTWLRGGCDLGLDIIERHSMAEKRIETQDRFTCRTIRKNRALVVKDRLCDLVHAILEVRTVRTCGGWVDDRDGDQGLRTHRCKLFGAVGRERTRRKVDVAIMARHFVAGWQREVLHFGFGHEVAELRVFCGERLSFLGGVFAELLGGRDATISSQDKAATLSVDERCRPHDRRVRGDAELGAELVETSNNGSKAPKQDTIAGDIEIEVARVLAEKIAPRLDNLLLDGRFRRDRTERSEVGVVEGDAKAAPRFGVLLVLCRVDQQLVDGLVALVQEVEDVGVLGVG